MDELYRQLVPYRDLILILIISIGAGLVVGGIIVAGRQFWVNLRFRRLWLGLDVLIKGFLLAGLGIFALVMAISYPYYVGLAEPPKVQHLVQIADSVNDGYIEDIYDCSDMAVAFWEKATPEGYRVRIAIGNIDREINRIDEANHAWCVVWVKDGWLIKDGWLAIEITGAFPVYPEENDLYYRGFVYDSPSELWQDFQRP